MVKKLNSHSQLLHSLKNGCNFASLFARRHGCLAQLVQSICLTSRGSAVRIRQHPPQETALIVNDLNQDFQRFLLDYLSILILYYCNFQVLWALRANKMKLELFPQTI